MSIFRGRKPAPEGHGPEDRASLSTVGMHAEDAAIERIFGPPDAADAPVTTESALTLSAVWRALSLVSGTVGKLPCYLYEPTEGAGGLLGRNLILDTPLARMLRLRPNPEMTASAFWSSTVANALQWGNGYAEIERDRNYKPVALWPIHASRATLRRVPIDPDRPGRGTALRYVVLADDRTPDGPRAVALPPEDVLHLPGLTFNGITGLSAIGYARESMGLGIAAQRYGSRFFGNSARPSGALTHPGNLTQEAAERLRDDWKRNYGGGGSQGTSILEEGMKYEAIGMPPEDAQFLQTRETQVIEVSRWYGVPPHKLGSMGGATFSNIDHQGSEFREDTIQPWVVRLEQEINHKLLGGGAFAEFDLDRLIVPSLADRAEAVQKFRNSGVLNGDEGRQMIGLSPISGGAGQTYWHPVNMAIVTKDGLAVLPYRPAEPLPADGGGDDPAVPDLPEIDPSDENRSAGDEPTERAPTPPATNQPAVCPVRALVPVFADVFERAQTREDRAKARCKAGDRAGWLDQWTVGHRGWVADQMLAPMRAALAARGADQSDATERAASVAALWCESITLEQRTPEALETAIGAAVEAAGVNT